MAEVKTKPTLKELKEKAVKLGFAGDIDSYNSIRQVQGVIDVLVNQTPVNLDKAPPITDETPELKAEAKPMDNKNSDDQRHKSKSDKMRDKLNSQPQTGIMINCESGEQPGTVTETIVNGKREVKTTGAVAKFTMNGYTTFVPKGVRYKVPDQIAELLGQSEADTANAGKSISIDRDRGVKDALT